VTRLHGPLDLMAKGLGSLTENISNHLYQIYVAPEFIDEKEMPISDVITWCIENLRHSTTNAMFLTEDELYCITYEIPFLDIINEENDSMWEWGEDGFP